MEEVMDTRIRFHTILRRLSGSGFTARLGDFYRGETAILRAIDTLSKESLHLCPSDIAAYLQISRPSVTSGLTALEKKGHLTRTLSDHDRRKIEIELTGAGRELLDQKAKEVDLWCEQMTDAMGEERFALFLSIIEEGLLCMGM